ncbi:hypothetical protein JKP88DRAFT_201660 [Tribonema minus]|uniref:Copper transport protein n=1 Tax=Tribonema minus TaxID=303371 RepID=A0A835YQY3_9STRA|nr:hypothetical protein JKP88DRAFT_201660 [Tribonema minus]
MASMSHMHGGGGSSGVDQMGGGSAAASTFCTGSGTVMQNGFQTSFTNGSCVIWLFPGAILDTEGKYAAAVIGTFLLAFGNEGLRWLRTRMAAEQAPPPPRPPPSLALSVAQMVNAYWLMLLTMLYESVMFSMIVLGLMAGYFAFNYGDARAARKQRSAATKGLGADDSSAEVSPEGSDDGMNAKALPTATFVSSSTPCCTNV